jgi:hypothetical protein
MNTKAQYKAILDLMTPLGQAIATISVNTFVTLHMKSGERLHGFVDETDDPRVLVLMYRDMSTDRHLGMAAVAVADIAGYSILVDQQKTKEK